VDQEIVADLFGVLDHHHRVRTRRECPAGRDVAARPRGDAPRIGASHTDPSQALEHRRYGLGSPDCIGRGDSVAVDR